MRGEIRAVRDALHCDSIAIDGTDLDRLVASATIALEDGLRVWIQPRLVQSSGADFFGRLAQAAAAAEVLRRRYSRVTFNVGCELSLFAPGVIPGADYHERAARMGTVLGWWLLPWYNRKLNKHLAQAAEVAP